MPKRSAGRGGKSAPVPSGIAKPANKSQADAQQRQKAAQRRSQVASLYHAGQTQQEIADRLGVSQKTVSDDLARLRAAWNAQATATIGVWVERELAFALAQRTSTLAEWQATHDSRLMAVVVRWTERLAKLLGLDAPDKIEINSKMDEIAAVLREHPELAPEAARLLTPEERASLFAMTGLPVAEAEADDGPTA